MYLEDLILLQENPGTQDHLGCLDHPGCRDLQDQMFCIVALGILDHKE